MKTITYTNNQDQQILLRGIQPYLQQWHPHLLPHRYGTQERTPGKRDDPKMGRQRRRPV